MENHLKSGECNKLNVFVKKLTAEKFINKEELKKVKVIQIFKSGFLLVRY